MNTAAESVVTPPASAGAASLRLGPGRAGHDLRVLRHPRREGLAQAARRGRGGCQPGHRARARRGRARGRCRPAGRCRGQGRLQRAGAGLDTAHRGHDLRVLRRPGREGLAQAARRAVGHGQPGHRNRQRRHHGPGRRRGTAAGGGVPGRLPRDAGGDDAPPVARQQPCRPGRCGWPRRWRCRWCCRWSACCGARTGCCRPGCNGRWPRRCSSASARASTAPAGRRCAPAAATWTCWWRWAPAPATD
jgi:hypothetical protein